jgi:hypothetical protein
LTLDAATGLIFGTIAPWASTLVPYYVSVTATDTAYSVQNTNYFTWTVNAVTVTLTQPNAQSNNVGDSVNLQLVAAASNGDPLTYSANGLPPGLTVDPNTGVISGTLTTASGFMPFFVSVTAYDPLANVWDTKYFVWSVT